MAETPPKRPREEQEECEVDEITKPHKKSYNYTPSTLEDEQQQPTQDLSEFFIDLQQELSSSDPLMNLAPYPEPDLDRSSNPSMEDEDEKERVIRHLLEASDDELGIPSRVVDGGGDGGGGGGGEISGGGYGDFSVLCDGLWELEDEAANYYTLLQSELFMQ